MLAEERYEKIVNAVKQSKSITVQKLTRILGSSESTVRRDLNKLHSLGEIIKVHGGAVAVSEDFFMRDNDVSERRTKNADEKRAIAKYAASLINKDDFVYIDAGSTTEHIIDYLTEKNAIYVTNAVAHSRRLAQSGFEVYLVGGKLKGMTEAIVGVEAAESLMMYNFTIGFWGANGIHRKNGFTTPDVAEASVKRASMRNCQKRYILADSSKFDVICPVRFADYEDATIITESINNAYTGYKNIIRVKI